MPPAPKPPALRQRRNRITTAAKLEAPPVSRAELPEGIPWHSLTRQWWDTIWSSPMADEWVDGDVPALIRIARLDHEFWTADDAKTTASLAAEIRQQQGRFGLTPFDRRSLQWEIQRVEGKKKPDPVVDERGRPRLASLA